MPLGQSYFTRLLQNSLATPSVSVKGWTKALYPFKKILPLP